MVNDSPDSSICINFGTTVYGGTSGDMATIGLIILAFLLVFHVVLPTLTGFSPGKGIVGLRVVKQETMQTAGLGANLVRWLLWIVDAFPFCFPLVGLITGLASDGHRRVGDMAASTVVVHKDSVGQIPQPATPTSNWNPPPPTMPAAPPSTSTPPFAPPTPTSPPVSTPPQSTTPPPSPDASPFTPPGSNDGAPPPPPGNWSPPPATTNPLTEAFEPPPHADPEPRPDPEPSPEAEPETVPSPETTSEQPPGIDAPQWDDARNTYIQWDPDLQQWMEWDEGHGRWIQISR